MTNREESNAAEHETFPGPGPLKTDEAKRGIRPVEQMVDAAIERIAREAQGRAAKAGSSRAEPGRAITLARSDAAALVSAGEVSAADGSAAGDSGSQLARVDRRGKARLRWKGLEVSEEFRSYAERVARGEDLPPFTGKILAEPDPAFPWDPRAQKQAARRALKQQVGLWTGVALFLGLSVAVLVVQVRKQADSWQTQESPLASVTLANQPSAEANLAGAAAHGNGTPENAPAAFHETALEGVAAQPGQLEDNLAQAAGSHGAAEAAAIAAASPATSAAVAQARPAPSGGAQRPAPAASAPKAAAASSAGVLVATRAPLSEANATLVSAAPAGEPGLKATGTAGTPAGASVTAGADLSGAGDPASALRADPKKEPTREASAMGSLLVESPSF